METESQIKFLARLPGDIHLAVKIAAAKNRRTMNSEIVVLIEKGLAAITNEKTAPGATETV